VRTVIDESTRPAGTPTPFKTVISNQNIPEDLPGTGNEPPSGGSGRGMAVALGFLVLASVVLGAGVLRWRKQ
jgi:hypothetical protein